LRFPEKDEWTDLTNEINGDEDRLERNDEDLAMPNVASSLSSSLWLVCVRRNGDGDLERPLNDRRNDPLRLISLSLVAIVDSLIPSVSSSYQNNY